MADDETDVSNNQNTSKNEIEMVENELDVTNTVTIHQEDDKYYSIADNERDVSKCPDDQTTNKEDTATNEIATGQYLGKYKSHINMHAKLDKQMKQMI